MRKGLAAFCASLLCLALFTKVQGEAPCAVSGLEAAREALARPPPPPLLAEGVCVVLLHFKRPRNIVLIVEALTGYPEVAKARRAAPPARVLALTPLQVIVLNNEGIRTPPVFTFTNPKVREMDGAASYLEKGMANRVDACLLCGSSWVLLVDDDLLLSRTGLKRLIEAKQAEPDRVWSLYNNEGAGGRNYDKAYPVYDWENKVGEVDMVAGRIMFMDMRVCAAFVGAAPLMNEFARRGATHWGAEDLFLALVGSALTRARPKVLPPYTGDIIELPTYATAISKRPNHLPFRSAFLCLAVQRLACVTDHFATPKSCEPALTPFENVSRSNNATSTEVSEALLPAAVMRRQINVGYVVGGDHVAQTVASMRTIEYSKYDEDDVTYHVFAPYVDGACVAAKDMAFLSPRVVFYDTAPLYERTKVLTHLMQNTSNYRWPLLKLLVHEYVQADRVMVIDSDMGTMDSLADCYNANIADYFMGAVIDMGDTCQMFPLTCWPHGFFWDALQWDELCVGRRRDRCLPKKMVAGINGGLLLLNAKRMREQSFWSLVLKSIQRLKSFVTVPTRWSEQEILNAMSIFDEHMIAFLPCGCNYQSSANRRQQKCSGSRIVNAHLWKWGLKQRPPSAEAAYYLHFLNSKPGRPPHVSLKTEGYAVRVKPTWDPKCSLQSWGCSGHNGPLTDEQLYDGSGLERGRGVG